MNRYTAMLAATLLLSASAVTVSQAATPMRCSHQLPPAHHIAIVVDKWAAEVETLSEGEIDVQVFGADSLVKANDNILSVAKGDIECAFSLNFQWGKTLPIMNVTVGPYTMSSIEAWKKWPSSEAAAFLEAKLTEKGVKNIAWMFQTNTSVFTSKGKALVTPDDFKGIKMRGIGPAFDRGLTAMGATTAAMPGSEVYQALATGVIDAAITDVAAAYSRKYFEVQDHMTVVPVLAAYLHGYVNPAWYEGLSDKSKAALKQAGEAASQWALDASIQAAADAPKQLEEKGVKIHIATYAENEALKAAMQPAFAEGFAEETGEDGKTLLGLIEKIQ
ncbi:TRAP transporter substrate-binding protein DctP [Mesorhizobium sp.]|uniref:TRAP transporter substrate-binding protein n=1 Tax=Mesorhizobium sp. TaxID=1871066 RepID=UPI000FE48020|nr:TRAP transporter substrate-binding protein DctP [Mesorhizobium sp.]RWD37000.1 MAG: C4-dicarboxylate ABC transporter [Mesorhizobium sp.]RWD85931.1 MAG: C4-dicarboxylate ABC transporter [Mesorhizobium sp.]RWF05039.1 MAG: C4-dicarboxylate ABC transporter [Mesorhizobium sp.]TIS40226.1 MAG: C4-dicarboxylate ABC transporter [Mesorhizobium sp.]